MTQGRAGLLTYRKRNRPGWRFWSMRDLGGWLIPKGEPRTDEAGLAAAQRSFRLATGVHRSTVGGRLLPASDGGQAFRACE